MKSSLVSKTSEASINKVSDDNRSQLPSFAEFFAGSGLVSEALKGIFDCSWANDISPKKAIVYLKNHNKGKFILGPIEELGGQQIPKVNMAWASFPCQDLSIAGKNIGINGSRSGLVWEWLRVIDEMQERPKILVAENVTGLVSLHEGDNYIKLHAQLVDRGYFVGAVQLDAINWLPQSRPRIFIIAVLQDNTIPEWLLSSKPNWAHSRAISMVAHKLENWLWWKLPVPETRKRLLKDIIEDIEIESTSMDYMFDLIPKKHLERLSVEDNSVFAGYKRTRNGSQTFELRFDGNAGCLRTPKGGSSRQFVLVKSKGKMKIRLLTVRETARLMGAPDSYVIPGTYNDGYMAMGDAVALPVARFLAQNLLSHLAAVNL